MIQQSSLLGEKFVELAAPGNEKPEGKLGDHPAIPLSRTNRNVEVEELLGALSLVLNGGGLAQLQTINHELGDALQGRETGVREHAHPARHVHRRPRPAEGARSTGRWTASNALAGTLAARTAHDRHRAGRPSAPAWT